jgi:hypothetical protein
MRLKHIALLVVAILLVVGSASAIAIAGAEDAMLLKVGPAGAMAIAGGEDEAGADDVSGGVYWWEDLESDYLTPDEQRLFREIVVLIFDRYFGIDVSRMTSEEMCEVGRLIGPEGKEKYYRLLKEYAQQKGFEIPEPPYEPCVAPPVEEVYCGVYWWKVVDAESTLKVLFSQIAQMKGISPEEVEERFGELFPGVDLWSMTLYEFDNFANSLLQHPPLPPLPLEPVCFEELRLNPYTFALFGRVPVFATEEELREFIEKLEQILDKAEPLLLELPRCEFPFVLFDVYRGTIRVVVHSDPLARAEEVYRIIAEKAESLFGIEEVPVVFIKGWFELQGLEDQSNPSHLVIMEVRA